MNHDEHSSQGAVQTVTQESAVTGGEGVVSRRWFLLKASIALNGVVGLALAYPILRYLFSPARSDADYKSWVKLGPISDFPDGQTRLAYFKNPYARSWDGQTDNVACYVRSTGGKEFQVFAVNCAHLNCPVRWFPESQLFMCPCHGGVYYANGERASGPPPRGLFTYDWKVEGSDLHINAGQMPTLSNTAKLVKISVGDGDSPCRA
jgi:quinol---cytochrome c reductase iron-sulfur subunit, bacillus type